MLHRPVCRGDRLTPFRRLRHRRGLPPQGPTVGRRGQDRPGVMGRVGTLLGEVGINIEAAQLSQTTDRTEAIMLLRVDRPVDSTVLDSIGAAVGARLVRSINFD